MLVILNATGLNRTYWLPRMQRRRDGQIWYVELCWLQLQVMCYSRAMGRYLVQRLGARSATEVTDHG